MFQFMSPTRIIFGEGCFVQSLPLIRQYGYNILLVSGHDLTRCAPLVDDFKQQKKRYQHVSVSSEPNITMIEETAALGRKFHPDVVVAIGGGSVMDTGKALAAIIPNQGSVYDYVEVIGRNVPLKAKPLPFIAIPTTASSGAEVTKKAVLRSGQDRIKVSLRSNDMIASLAIVDPALTYGTERCLSGRGVMEAFANLMEVFVCSAPNLLTDMVCKEGLEKIAISGLKACLHDNKGARSDVSFAAMLGGVALNNGQLGAAHGLAAALGGKLEAPHSVITSRLAPFVMHENIVMAARQRRHDILARYKALAEILTGRRHVNVEDGVLWVNMMLDQLDIPPLDSFGICQTSFEKVTQDALRSHSIKGNPMPLTSERLMYVLNQVCRCGGSEVKQTLQTEVNSVEVVEQTNVSTPNSYSS
ncbi:MULTISPECIES: iron-containing alcohol dehydrogenase [Vibrio]|uniref:Iron-containing alcohol dehydrogenase n=2 Tax=Vibrio TaxID=662 RepID=A0A7X4RWV8_9VIBR|nr:MULTISPECIES: iron-containing alcohol dehydrogenase [Vibrio]MBF9000047.1 iron-containing alcohol dehydrogenase [Vibrio nitrifigilis]MZI95785.1 iron-containing alcohol dehydrogenase [Vibrio eleionomae]